VDTSVESLCGMRQLQVASSKAKIDNCSERLEVSEAYL